MLTGYFSSKQNLRIIRFKRPHHAVRNISNGRIVEFPLYDVSRTEIESGFYGEWRNRGFFNPDTQPNVVPGKRPVVMCLPPPNITGDLHIGHALANTIEDALGRWYRMKGHPVLLIPGTDHAGIATQVVVEKRLSEGVTRHSIGREAFVEKVEEWSKSKRKDLRYQMARLGLSADWSREFYTLSPELSTAVREAFRRLYAAGKIYRADRIINWCCALQSAISDIEVEWKEIKKSTDFQLPGDQGVIKVGTLYTFAYPLEDGGEIRVATTRPETMLGDTGLAVRPDIGKFMGLIGKRARHPFFPDRLLPVVGDDAVTEVGTGVVKLTPGHSSVDFHIAKRNSLPLINILNNDGTLNENAGSQFQGLLRSEARTAVLDALASQGLLHGQTDHQQRIPVCSRTGDLLEPVVRPQWFVRCSGEMAQNALEAVESGQLKLYPSGHVGEWRDWMNKCEDWCISRQLWWGHRIPAWYRTTADNDVEWKVPMNSEEEQELTKSEEWNQDEDVLDTWFSSALVPFSAVGWPNTKHSDFTAFYPNSILETGVDILFFWVARMTMLGLELTSQLPFSEVLLHGLVCDRHGAKMSKSRGNTIDVAKLIDGSDSQKIPFSNQLLKDLVADNRGEKISVESQSQKDLCGADALRMTILSYNSKQGQINFSIDEINKNRRFLNKVWNLVRFALERFMKDGAPQPFHELQIEQFSVVDRWLLEELNNVVQHCHDAIDERNCHLLTDNLMKFWRGQFSAVYVPTMQYTRLKDARDVQNCVLAHAIDIALRLLHPVSPFASEFMWRKLEEGRGFQYPTEIDKPSLCVAAIPEPLVEGTWISQNERELIEEILQSCFLVKKWIGSSAILRENLIGLEFTDESCLEILGSLVAGNSGIRISEYFPDTAITVPVGKHLNLRFLESTDFNRLIETYESKIAQKNCEREKLVKIGTRTSLLKVKKLERSIESLQDNVDNLKEANAAMQVDTR